MVERVDLEQHRHADRQRWCNGDLWDPAAVVVTVGLLGDGRWFVQRHQLGGAEKALAYGTEWLARGTARRWMRTIGGTWAEA